MSTMTIRNLDDQLKARLRVQAAVHGRSMEDEVRDILRAALATQDEREAALASSIRARLAHEGGVDLEIPAREPMCDPVDLSR